MLTPRALLPALALACALAFGSAGCRPTGPELPENVGSTHAHPERTAGREAEDATPAEPVPVGTPVWADFHDTGFHFHGVVVERREDQHRVIYDDGASEWVAASALLPDHLAEEARIDVRRSFADEFAEATVARSVGRALYVRLAGGDEIWAPLPHVRFQRGADGTPRHDTPAPPRAEPVEGQIGSSVLVNYQRQGLRFAGVVTARAEDGRLHVVYLDGETEWVEPQLVGPDDIGEGSIVHIRRAWEPPDWVRGRVQQRIGDAFRVELDDGGVAWSTLFRVRAPIASDAAPPPETATPIDDGAAAPLPDEG